MSQHPLDGMKIMVIDDSSTIRRSAEIFLLQAGCRVVLAEDGTQAAQLLDVELPSVLITDVEMPGLDGFELTRENAEGALPSIFADAGLQCVEQVERLRTATGTMAFYVATAPGARSVPDGTPAKLS